MSLLVFIDTVSDINLAIAVFIIMEKVLSLFVLIGLEILSVSLVIRSSTKDLAPLCPMIRWSLVYFDATQPDEIFSLIYSDGLPWPEWLQLDFFL